MRETTSLRRKVERVALAAPARAVTEEEMRPAIETLRRWGLEVVIPDGLYARDGQLAGSDSHRTAVMQTLIDRDDMDAVVCCRGGYGTVRIVDRLEWSRFAERPKWIVGYSDITVLHSHIHATLGLPTLHATMPINMHGGDEATAATESLRHALMGQPERVEWRDSDYGGPECTVEGMVVGGNLSILYSLMGSRSQMETRGKILLIEDLDEYIYHIDRMMQALRRGGMLTGLRALIVGGMNDMHDNATPFGKNVRQIVAEATEGMGYPVIFDAPIGHLGDNNMALPLGWELRLDIDSQGHATLTP